SNGTAFCTGARQLASAAAAVVKPIVVRKSRRVSPGCTTSCTRSVFDPCVARFISVMTTGAIQLSRGRWLPRQVLYRSLEAPRRNMGVLAMTFEAPAHGQRSGLFHAVHAFHGAMASLARDAGKHMLAVVEIHEIGKVMNLNPADRAPLLHSFFQLFNFDGLFFK